MSRLPALGSASLLRSVRTLWKDWIAGSLPSRVDPQGSGERDQARIRVWIGLLIAAYLTAYLGADTVERQIGLPGLLIAPVFLAYAVLVLAWCVWRPQPSTARRIIALAGDIGAVSYGLAVSGALGAPWYPIYLWVTFGNAIRYGLRYLYAGMLLSVVGFSVVIHVDAFWRRNPVLGWGLLAGLCVLPIYTAQLLRSLNAALVRAEEANRAKTRFLANMSHELRTPLNGVIAVGDMLAETRLTPVQRDMARTSQTSAHALLGLIDQVLDISKIETDRLDRQQQPFDLHELLRRSVEIVRPQAVSKGLDLKLFVDSALPHALLGYPAHLRQVLLNLLGNAVKFTERGHVALRVAASEHIGTTLRIRFEIADTGIGIPEEARPRVFEPFAQADESITRRYGGTGLGTTIAKQIVDLLGGDIRFESQEGLGTTFRFELEFGVEGAEPDRAVLAGLRVHAAGLGGAALARLRQRCEEWKIELSVDNAPAAGERGGEPDAVLVDAGRPVEFVSTDQRGTGARPSLGDSTLVAVGAETLSGETLAEAVCLTTVPDLDDRVRLARALHLARSGRRTDPGEAAPPPAHGSLRILLAEDNLTNQRVARMILEDAGHRVDVVGDGRAALARLEAGAYDLAVLDMHMPEMGGVEAVQLYRFAHPESAMPFILLTADATTTAAQTSEDAGIDVFLTKPVRPATLRAAVLEVAAGVTFEAGRAPALDAVGSGHSPPLSTGVPLDLETLDELALMNARREGFLEDLVRVFLADADSRLRTMRRAIAGRDWHGFAHEAHRLKGAAGSVGAESLYRACGVVEDLDPGDVAGTAARRLDAITRECERTRAALEAHLEASRPTTSPAPPARLRRAG